MSPAIRSLEEEITTLAAHIHSATCRWLELIARYDQSEGWADTGAKSCAHWVAWSCGISPVAAREHVRVARRLTLLPLVRASFARGELSYTKVRALTRMENVADEEGLLTFALAASAQQLQRVIRATRSTATVAEAARRAHAERFFDWHHDEDGAIVLRGRMPAEEGAVVIAAIQAAIDSVLADASAEAPVPARGSDADASAEAPMRLEEPADAQVSYGARRADALVLLADSLLASGAQQRRSADRHQIVVHVDAMTLAPATAGAGAVSGSPGCELEDGPQLPPETARRLCCDSSLVRIVERDGKPLSVGRRTRTIPPGLRRVLDRRDRGCCFPGCGQTRGVDAHHITHWAHGGATDLENLVSLCRYHHRLVHEGGFGVERSRGGAAPCFRAPDGRRIQPTPRPGRGACERLVARNHRASVRPHDETCVPGDGGYMDLGLAVEFMHRVAPALEAVGI
jgi:hypothetical protein